MLHRSFVACGLEVVGSMEAAAPMRTPSNSMPEKWRARRHSSPRLTERRSRSAWACSWSKGVAWASTCGTPNGERIGCA